MRLNLSRRGVGLSFGLPGFRVSSGPSGMRLRAGIPGTGLSVTRSLGGTGAQAVSGARPTRPAANPARPPAPLVRPGALTPEDLAQDALGVSDVNAVGLSGLPDLSAPDGLLLGAAERVLATASVVRLLDADSAGLYHQGGRGTLVVTTRALYLLGERNEDLALRRILRAEVRVDGTLALGVSRRAAALVLSVARPRTLAAVIAAARAGL